ncbi:MAG: hypothetical protein QM800_07390 [Paludibacter sp.]
MSSSIIKKIIFAKITKSRSFYSSYDVGWSHTPNSGMDKFYTVRGTGAAFAQSALDNGDKGFKEIAIGTAVNLGSGALGSGASKLAKGVGEKGLGKVANNIVGSKTAITKSVQNLTNTSTKTARVIAKSVQNAEKVAAKEVKESVQTTTKGAVTEASKKYYEQKCEKSKY